MINFDSEVLEAKKERTELTDDENFFGIKKCEKFFRWEIFGRQRAFFRREISNPRILGLREAAGFL